MIIIREPMRIGDLIERQDIEGKIEEIQIRDTDVLQMDGQLVVVPNFILFKNPVQLESAPDRNAQDS